MEIGAQPGNQNAVKGKEFRQALKRVLARRSEVVTKGLEEVAEKLVDAALAGESWAVREIADRFDGKPAQAIIGGDADDPPIKVEGVVNLVRPTEPG